MSGRGSYSSRFMAGRLAEREDILALLRRRRDNAETVERRTRGMEELAPDRRRQLEVLIETIEQGLHFGEADVEAVRGRAD